MTFIIVCLICWDLVLTAIVAGNWWHQINMWKLQNDLNEGTFEAFKRLIEREASLLFHRNSDDTDKDIQTE